MPGYPAIPEEEEDVFDCAAPPSVDLPPSVNVSSFTKAAPPVWPVGTLDNMFRNMALSLSMLATSGIVDARFSVVTNCQNPLCPGIVIGAPVSIPEPVRGHVPPPEFFNHANSRTVAAFVKIMRTIWETGRETFGADMGRVVGPHQLCDCPSRHDFSEWAGCAFCFRGGCCPMCSAAKPGNRRMRTMVQCSCDRRPAVSASCRVHGMPTMTLMMIPPEPVVEAIFGSDDDADIGVKRPHPSDNGGGGGECDLVMACMVGAVESEGPPTDTYRALTDWLDIQAAFNTGIREEVGHVMKVTRGGIMHNGCLRIQDSGSRATNAMITQRCLPLDDMMARNVNSSSMQMGASVSAFCEFACTPLWQQ